MTTNTTELDFNPVDAPASPPMDRLLSASREELDLDMEIVEGELPTDAHGHIYINSAVGSVNSGGLPFVKFEGDGSLDGEWNTPIFNGDGYVIRMDFDQPGKLHLKTCIVKTPSFWADHALREGGPAREDKRFRKWIFKNLGMARMNLVFGQRNQANVAVIPVQFDHDPEPRMLATYEAGRPWEINPDSLEVIAPVGKSEDFDSMMPTWFWRYVFPAVMTTAHPVFDPYTKDFYICNFVQGVRNFVGFSRLMAGLDKNPDKVVKRIERELDKASEKEDKEEAMRDFENWLTGGASNDFSEADEKEAKNREEEFVPKWEKLVEKVYPGDFVNVLRWNGHPDLKKWRVRCNGKDITISHNMHQMGITRDYLILSNCSFKNNVSMMFNFIFPKYPQIESKIRDLVSRPQNPYADLYFIKREDLIDEVDVVHATHARIPLETVHFSCNYENPDGKVTIMTAHNTANCPAEWVRHFDRKKFDGEPMKKSLYGFLAVGQMDIGRVGRYVFDAEKGGLVEEETSVLFEKGNVEEPDNIGPHTWGVGLYSYRGYEEVDHRPAEIKNIYWQIFGLDREYLTDFVYDLYKNYPNREVSIEEVERLTQKGVPTGLARVDHSAPELKLNDFYMFEKDHHMRSIQFLPRKTRTEGLPEDMDGYVMCTITVPVAGEGDDRTYRGEVWLWDAAKLSEGPVCKLHHPKFKFAYTFHSVWTKTAAATNPINQIGIIDDIDDMVKWITNPVRQVKIEEFMDLYVYPHFKNQQNYIDDEDPADYLGKAYKAVLKLFKGNKKP
ncbi:MAG TPA: hypothetical protein DCE41_36235 [Cytophagales bacterium]|nr:hypothetical protein [Cytophagales bacterium]HAP59094.1 hypothetical protein [Cytophagales bacterium]